MGTGRGVKGETMRVLILGGDGYLGWAQAMSLSRRGHRIGIIDSLHRRRFDQEHGETSLAPLATLQRRVEQWYAESGERIRYWVGDTLDYEFLSGVFSKFQPDAAVHFAEQRSAPFSMIDRKHAVYTQHNNVIGTLNVLFAIRECAPECHLVKLGSMGVYGKPNIDITEGFLEIKHNGRSDILPFPKQPGSFYTLTKAHDSNNIMFCCHAWGIKATDLHQGVVYGVATEETLAHPDLATRFDYDQIYGTALNRFCVQAAIEYPLTVYGSGRQTWPCISLADAMRCVRIAVETVPAEGEYRVFNQFTEYSTIGALAELVCQEGQKRELETRVQALDNPRVEKEIHYYRPEHQKLPALGFEPEVLLQDTVGPLIDAALVHRERVNRARIAPTVNWRRTDNRLTSAPENPEALRAQALSEV